MTRPYHCFRRCEAPRELERLLSRLGKRGLHYRIAPPNLVFGPTEILSDADRAQLVRFRPLVFRALLDLEQQNTHRVFCCECAKELPPMPEGMPDDMPDVPEGATVAAICAGCASGKASLSRLTEMATPDSGAHPIGWN